MIDREDRAESSLPSWPHDEKAICERIGNSSVLLKILLKVRDPSSAEECIRHHARIVGFENLVVVADRGSGPDVLELHGRYGDRVCVFAHDRFHDDIHRRDAFPGLFDAIDASCSFFVVLDADERLVRIDGGWHANDVSIVEALELGNGGSFVAAPRLERCPPSRTRFRCGSTLGALAEPIRRGRPILRASSRIEGITSHNGEIDARYRRGVRSNGFFVLSDANPVTEEPVLAGPDDRAGPLGPGCIELGPDGRVVYYGPGERTLIESLAKDSERWLEGALGPGTASR